MQVIAHGLDTSELGLSGNQDIGELRARTSRWGE